MLRDALSVVKGAEGGELSKVLACDQPLPTAVMHRFGAGCVPGMKL